MKLIAAGLFVFLLLAVGVIALIGDQRTHTIFMAPEISDGWTVPPPLGDSKIPHKSQTACEMIRLYPFECQIFPNSFPRYPRLQYRDSGVRVLVVAGDLLDPDHSRTGEWRGFTPALLDHRIVLQITTWSKNPATFISLNRIHVRCGEASDRLTAKSAQYFAHTMMRVLPIGTMKMPEFPGLQMGSLLISSDPRKTKTCVLDFSEAIKSASERPVPAIRLNAVPVAYYRLIF